MTPYGLEHRGHTVATTKDRHDIGDKKTERTTARQGIVLGRHRAATPSGTAAAVESTANETLIQNDFSSGIGSRLDIVSDPNKWRAEPLANGVQLFWDWRPEATTGPVVGWGGIGPGLRLRKSCGESAGLREE